MKSHHWVVGLLLASLQFCLAQPGSPPPIRFSFINSAAPVYDLTGRYRFDQEMALAGGLRKSVSLDLSINQDASGRLQGSGPTTVQIGAESYRATYIVSGRVSGGGRSTRATLVARLRGQDAAAGVDPACAILLQYRLAVSPAGLRGEARGSVKLANLGRGRIQSLISGVGLPPGVDGSWSVQLNMLSPDKPAGTGAIQLPNGRSLPGSLAGSISRISSLKRLTLTGVNAARGSALKLGLFPQTGALQELSGRILGQSVSASSTPSRYAGSPACSECHGPVYQTFVNTPHAQVGVQCEGCHGPTADHAANYYDPLVRPQLDLTGVACGTCHSGPQHPTYEEWSSSGHAEVVVDFSRTNRISTCGACHSGSVRVSLLDGVPLPAAGANVPIGCPTCHVPHQATANPALLRNPLASTNDFFLTTSDVFTNRYDPAINLCGQCHNHRGASWTDTQDAPHHSPQYNFLLGTVGELASGSATWNPATHAGLPESARYSISGTFYLTNQCSSCHMQDDAAPAGTASHTFTVDTYGVCANCHVGDVGLLIQLVAEPAVSNRVYQLKLGLDLWASGKAPAGLQTNGVLAWEYTRPGGLIWQTNNGLVSWVVTNQVGFKGPDAAGQALIPDTIKKARFNMYLVLGDGSFGVHNPLFAVDLLETATGWVNDELNK